MSAGLLVIGGSYAGLNIALAARDAGYEGRIVIYSDEGELGYQRPPLSKGLLKGEFLEANLPLRPQTVYDAKAIAVHLGRRCIAVDRSRKVAHFDDGSQAPYAQLAIATGSRPAVPPLPGVELDGVATLRTLDDARKLRALAAQARHIVLVGGGFIGLEVAASMTRMGLRTTVIEACPRLMARSVSEITSGAILELHRNNGVDIRLGTAVAEFLGDAGRLSGIRLATGEIIPADIALLAVGSRPNGELGASAGLEMRGNAIVVDGFCRTSDPAIFAAGDCAIFQSPFAGGDWLRIESVANATEQGKIAGKAIAGTMTPYTAVPWFWSDQYEVKLQIAGIAHGQATPEFLGNSRETRFSVVLVDGRKITAVESLNDPANHLAARKQIGQALVQPLPAGAAKIEASWLQPA